MRYLPENHLRDCTIVDHRDHKYNFVADVAERERKAVEAVLQETKAKDVAVEEGLETVKAMETRVQAKITGVSKDVDVFFDEQVKALEEMRANLKLEVKTQGQAKLKALCNQEEMLALSLAQLRNSIQQRAIVDHRDHKYNFVADVAERERKAVEAVLQETKAKDVAVEEGLETVKAMETRVQAKITGVSKDVDVFFDEQVKALEEMRANLKLEVKTQGQAKLKALCNQEEMLALSLAQLRNSIDFAEKALKDGNDLEILSIKQQLIQRLAQLNASQFHCKPCNSDYLKLKMHKKITDIGEMMTLAHAPDTSKCVLSMVGCEEGVLYQTFAGQPVNFKFAIVGSTSVKEAETGFMVRASVKKKDQQESQDLPVRDKGDGLYFFSYQPQTPGLCTLSVTVEGESVHGSPFTWEVLQKFKSPDELKNILNRESGNNKTKHCWKLKYLGSTPGNSKVEIGVNYYDGRYGSTYRYTWCCQNNVYTTCRSNSSGNQASITSLQNDDILSVYLNQTAKNYKLVIYNHRNEQLEAFSTCSHSIHTVVISPYKPSEGGFTFAIE